MYLAEMTQEEFDVFMDRSLQAYSDDVARCLDVDRSLVVPDNIKLVENMLPKGRSTKDHYFFHLKSNDQKNLGWLWFCMRESYGRKKLFICDIFVEPEHQGQGHGTFMLRWIESKAKEMKIKEIGLHVFGHNTGARKLYESLGYIPKNINMTKVI